jgi:hypothetical protein
MGHFLSYLAVWLLMVMLQLAFLSGFVYLMVLLVRHAWTS